MIDEAPLSIPAVVIFKQDTGALVVVGPKGTMPYAGQSWVPLPTGYDPDIYEWNATARMMVESIAKVERDLIVQVKQKAASLKMLSAISPGTAKTQEYRLKWDEAKASVGILATVINTLSSAAAMAQYPTATTEARLTGEPVATVLARYLKAGAESDPETRRLSAIEWNAKVKIKAAATASAKRAAFNAVNWDWKP